MPTIRRASEATEVVIPLALIGTGFAIYAVAGFLAAGAKGVGGVMILVAVQLIVGLVLGIFACFITARILNASFGYLNTAILKLAAVFVFPSAVAMIIPGVGWIASLVLYCVLLMWLFDLEFFEVLVLTFVLWMIRFLAVFLAVAVAST